MRISDWSSDVCSSDLLWLAVKLATSERVRMSPALRLRIPQPINSFKRSSTQSVRPTPQRLGPRTRPGMRRRVGADSRWGYNRWQNQLLLILGDSGKEVLGDSLRSISRQERTTRAEHQSTRLPSRPQPPSEGIVQSLVTTLRSFGPSLDKVPLPLAIGELGRDSCSEGEDK